MNRNVQDNRVREDWPDTFLHSVLFPIRFNALKHHRNYILGILESASPEKVVDLLNPICNNYIDIYTGSMAPESIVENVVLVLKSEKALSPEGFSNWIGSKNGFRKILIKDRSEWIVRQGNEAEHYIHIHPARTGPFSVRFKGSTLKTIYLLKINGINIQETLLPEKVNQIRLQIGLSPIKKLEHNKGILNCFATFFERK